MKTLVVGASEHPERYSNKAIHMLKKFGHEVVALANKAGQVDEVVFITERKFVEGVDTITMYINPQIQKEYYAYLVSLKPRRVIFNPGTENAEFYELLQQYNIEIVIACTLVLLSTHQF